MTFDDMHRGWSYGRRVRKLTDAVRGILVGLAIVSISGFGLVGTGLADEIPFMDKVTDTPTASATVTEFPTLPPTSTATAPPTATATPTTTATPSPIPTYAMSANYNHDDNPLNGYFQPDRGWIPGLISTASWMIPHPSYSYGSAVWYAPWVMEGTARARGMSLEGYVDGVSLLSPSDIGETVWMRKLGGEWEGPFLVVDCAQQNHHFAAAYYNGETVEIGWETAKRWGMVGGAEVQWKLENVEVYKSTDSPQGDLGNPVYYPDWWLAQVTFE